MTAPRIVVLPGDGVGPEVTRAAVEVLREAASIGGFDLECETWPIGGAAIDASGSPLPDAVRDAALAADAVFLGAVGDPRFDAEPPARRPETGLLALRRALGVYANLRPVVADAALLGHSPLRPERVAGTDLLIVRELLGGAYFGEPRWRTPDEAVDTIRYRRDDVARVARVAFDAARGRRGRLLSVDKANVLDTSRLWRETVQGMTSEWPDVAVEHGYVDSVAMRLVTEPRGIDVLVTENLFGDILSDEAAMLTGSLGMLPSASLGADGAPGLFEPVHGSAPDIAGNGIANPLATFLSAAMMLRHGLGMPEEAARLEEAVDKALEDGLRTPDLAGGPAAPPPMVDVPPEVEVGTAEMTAAVIEALN